MPTHQPADATCKLGAAVAMLETHLFTGVGVSDVAAGPGPAPSSN